MVLTAMGEDRMGKLTSITERILSHGGSLERSKISRLEGELAMILEIAITEEKGAQLLAALKQEENLQVETPDVHFLFLYHHTPRTPEEGAHSPSWPKRLLSSHR